MSVEVVWTQTLTNCVIYKKSLSPSEPQFPKVLLWILNEVLDTKCQTCCSCLRMLGFSPFLAHPLKQTSRIGVYRPEYSKCSYAWWGGLSPPPPHQAEHARDGGERTADCPQGLTASDNELLGVEGENPSPYPSGGTESTFSPSRNWDNGSCDLPPVPHLTGTRGSIKEVTL